MIKKILYVTLFSLFLSPAYSQTIALDKLILPDGFSINLYAKLKNPRQMSLGDDGTVYVGSIDSAGGRIYAVLNPNNGAVASEVVVIDKGLKLPSGLTYKDGDLYVGAVSHIYRYNDIAANLKSGVKREVITDKLPTKSHHGWKFLEFGPDGLLYIPIGAPCNICEPDEIFASIHRMDVNSADKTLEHVARGIRNTVGFDWDPVSGDLWFTDNGRDAMGDEMPADELNHVTKINQHFGYPYIHQGDTPDPEFGIGKNPADYTPPAQKLAPHAGAIGMAFYKGDMFPSSFKNNIIIAEHGSWNRSKEVGHTGHMLTLVTIKDGKAVDYQPFITGWLQNNKAWGRPADVLELKDGSLLIADDQANALYRVTYKQ